MPNPIMRRGLARDLVLILAGSAVFAVGLNCFEIPNGIAAGGAAGLATVLSELIARAFGVRLGVGALHGLHMQVGDA